MNDFFSKFTSESYARSYCVVRRIKGGVFVEGSKDMPFWRQIFECTLNQDDIEKDINYRIYCTSRGGSRSKPSLMKHTKHASKYFMLAIDSDLDYICENSSINSNEIKTNKFIIQTYYYSRENINYHRDCLKKYAKKIYLNDEIKFNFSDYIDRYSSLIHDCLSLFLYTKDRRITSISLKEFNKAIKPKKAFLDSNYQITNPVFNDMIEKVKIITSQLEALITNKNDFNHFMKEIRQKGFSQKTAYLFIKGHFFEDSVIKPLFENIIIKNKENEEAIIRMELKDVNNETILEERIRELNNYFSGISISNISAIDDSKLQLPIIKRIMMDIKSI